MKPRFFVYKLRTDNGGAPCVTSDLLSLAICKPSIRSAAEPGDWIFGFGDNKILGNRLIYIAEVTGKLTSSAYYLATTFASRADCIYRRSKAGRLERKRTAKFHADKRDMRKDLGDAPRYSRANVLLSTSFRYFGRRGVVPRQPLLQEFVRRLIQGHRSKFEEEPRIVSALKALRDEV